MLLKDGTTLYWVYRRHKLRSYSFEGDWQLLRALPIRRFVLGVIELILDVAARRHCCWKVSWVVLFSTTIKIWQPKPPCLFTPNHISWEFCPFQKNILLYLTAVLTNGKSFWFNFVRWKCNIWRLIDLIVILTSKNFPASSYHPKWRTFRLRSAGTTALIIRSQLLHCILFDCACCAILLEHHKVLLRHFNSFRLRNKCFYCEWRIAASARCHQKWRRQDSRLKSLRLSGTSFDFSVYIFITFHSPF